LSNNAELEEAVVSLCDRVDALEQGHASQGASAPATAPADDADTVYANTEEWVTEWLSRVFGRRLSPTTRWCAHWREHPEACWRLEGMWRAWEASRYDIWLGVSIWVNVHFDPSWAILTSADGTFRACDRDNHTTPPDLPVAQVVGGRDALSVGAGS
jgi:hypothetical protein